MSKGADDDTEMEAGMTTSERRRRRRRGAGLRIPSDNVPRRTGPVVAPVPEDPAVAMSIAYAFSDESAPSRLPTGDLEVDGDVDGLGDLEDATSFSPPPEPSADGSVPGVTAEDAEPDGRTRQMAAVSLEALGLTDVEEMLAEASGNGTAASNTTADVDIDVDGLEDAPDDDHLDDAIDVTGDTGERRPAPRAPSMQGLSALAAAAAAAADDGDDFGESEAPIARRPATVPPPFPTRPMESTSSERARTDVEPAEAVEARAEARAAKAEPAVPAGRLSRAATVALSEDDLEELLEMTPPPQRAPQPPAAVAPVAIPSPGPGLSAIPDPISSTPSSPSTPVAAPQAAPIAAHMGNITGEAVALAEEDLQEVATPADAGDSGEILADEIVEVEQEGRAPAVPSIIVGPQSSGPVAMPPSHGAAPPPPPAAPVHAKPPAAPVPKKPLAARHAQAAAAQSSSDPEGNKKKRPRKPWFEEVFDEDYLRTLPFLTPQATQAEALMVIESLGVQPGAAVLDVGCGYGRHAMELAARGFHVVGVDLSLPLLLRGADEAQRRGLDINFVHADMREMDFDAQFDGAYCLFSTFGFFDDETNKKAASLIAKALKPGAKFMLEILNRDYVIGDLPARVWWEGDGCVVLEEVEFNYFSSRVQSKRSVVFDDGRQVEQEISVRVYSLHEVGKLLHAAGLRVLEVSGSMASRGRFLGTRSREIIVVAERRPPDGKS